MDIANLDPLWWMVAAAVIVVLVLVVAFVVRRRRRRREHLRERFGPEYSRTVERSSSRRRAEADLSGREERRDAQELRDLDATERERFLARWDEIQLHFVESPPLAMERADTLLREVMRARGYDDHDEAERRAAELSVDHPGLVERYREAHHRIDERRGHPVSTEDRRESLLLLRSIFDAICDAPGTRERAARRRPEGALASTPSAGDPEEAAPPGSRPGEPLPPPPGTQPGEPLPPPPRTRPDKSASPTPSARKAR